MSVVGIVAEYNPFHLGHALHLEQTRSRLGSDPVVVCVQSGDFVQRGEPALLSKHARAEAAVRCGVNLVLELPLAWSLASAEGFARGAIGMLADTGVVDVVSFGSEAGVLAPLEQMAAALDDPQTDAAVVRELAQGDGYAAARQRALESVLGEAAKQIAHPNNILAVEYLRAMRQFPQLHAMTIPRIGAGHDQPAEAEQVIQSASALRAQVRQGIDIASCLPAGSAAMLREEQAAGRGPMSVQALEQALLSRLRMLPREAFSALPDASEGLGDRLYHAVRTQCGLEEILAEAKCKRYAMARLRRMCLCAALGVRAEDAAGRPPYLRVLAADAAGRALLRRMTAEAGCPVLTKPAAVRMLDARAQQIFEQTAAARDLYCLGWLSRAARVPGGDWRATPCMR